jgi:hypothetical protein
MSTTPTEDTMVEFMEILSWSFFWLQLGRWPTHDPWGREYVEGTHEWQLAHDIYWLADGFFGILFAIIGDLDYFHKNLRLANHSSGTSPCIFCPANLFHPNWRDFRPGAAWIHCCYNRDNWLAKYATHLPIFDLLFVSSCTVCGDYMHCKYLGSDQYFFGSIFWLLCFKIIPGDPKDNLASVVSQLKVAYSSLDTPHRYGMITQGMFISKKAAQPKMKGRAAEVRIRLCEEEGGALYKRLDKG